MIDGLHRSQSARASIPHLASIGVFISDNADRPEFTEYFEDLEKEGFKGMGPIHRHGWETSVFYRRDNCLGI